MKLRIVIIGAGGHGKVVCDAIIAQNMYEIIGFVDATIPVGTVIFNSYKIIAAQKDLKTLIAKADLFIVAIGNNQLRAKISAEAALNLKPAKVIHPTSVIGSDVKISSGTVVLANAVINALSNIGENTIVNSGVIVDHDCVIGNNVHLSIGTMVGSNSIIADSYTSSIGEKINSFSKL
jgi:sugar O-acyltransferase (sialic acid O-acetyltransferase NeuD family)